MGGSPAEAADGGAVIISDTNVGTGSTSLVTTGTYAFWGRNNYGVLGESSSVGVYGQTASTVGVGVGGVFGISNSSTGQTAGVHGISLSSNGLAVFGRNARGGNAVLAEVPATSTANAIALYALNYSTYTGGGPEPGGSPSMDFQRKDMDWSAPRRRRALPR